MPEQRARAHHRNRVANTFSEEIGAMLEGELSDPRIAPSYVTDVVLAPGGKSARIYVAVHGSEEEEQSTLLGLMTPAPIFAPSCASAWESVTFPTSPSPSTALKR